MAKTLGLVGCGAFGEFMLRHLTPYFRTLVHDPYRDLAEVTAVYDVEPASLERAAACEVVVPAVPVQKFERVISALLPHLRPGALLVDVCSVKLEPYRILERLLPPSVDFVCTHPLFGPQSGKDGIAGLKIAVCEGRGGRADCVARFLEERLRLKVVRTDPERHDRELAYVQGLTHLIAKIMVEIEPADVLQTTKTWELLMQSVELVRYDSDELFLAIESENPFVAEAKARFFDTARALEARLAAAARTRREGGAG
ncbi:MAG: prephenate dehydrogenase [Geminicoccaceae bacterium]|nr:prephenate dehydrogenase [Geminicoccaceae bacterium]MCX8102241.1 prephenate dehydrogenase [Geminicoccaceae bacterium]